MGTLRSQRNTGQHADKENQLLADEFSPGNLRIFRRRYPEGTNLVVSADVDRPFAREIDGLKVRFVGMNGLIKELKEISDAGT
ncbi:MAG TPA: hypothetical protein ENH32_04650 [Proteobacteria bacterium]|nr:hypothetical protein [Pseudomonadota bacterium]